jgi:DNA-binding NarL/FixJ family response regulator
VRVAIAEDSVLLRKGLILLLEEAGHEIVAAAGDAETFLRAVADTRPDVCVVDVRMPPTFTDEGLRAAVLVRDQWPDVGVLVLSQWVEERYATELIAGRPARTRHPLGDLTPREREVLTLMAEGRSNGAIAAALVVGAGAVEKHINNIFTKLGLAAAERDHRRVLAVLRYLGTS